MKRDTTIFRYKDYLPEDIPFKIEVRTLANYTVEAHSHDSLQLCYVTKGSIVHSVNDKRVVAIKGDFFSIPPFLEHQITPHDDHEFEIIQIDFMPFFINERIQSLSEMDHLFDFAFLQPLIVDEEELLPKLHFSSENQKLAESLIKSMLKEFENKEDGYQISIKADLLKLLVITGREMRSNKQSTEDQRIINRYRQALDDAIVYMERNYFEDIRLEELAKKAHLTPSYYSSLFNVLMGRSYTEYLNEIRLQKAMELLVEKDMNITDIIYAVGYRNVSHFNKRFKLYTGVTPSEFRKHGPKAQTK